MVYATPQDIIQEVESSTDLATQRLQVETLRTDKLRHVKNTDMCLTIACLVIGVCGVYEMYEMSRVCVLGVCLYHFPSLVSMLIACGMVLQLLTVGLVIAVMYK
jgi:hypothetical protein